MNDEELIGFGRRFGTPFQALIPPGHVRNFRHDGSSVELAELSWHVDHTRYPGQLSKEGFLHAVVAPTEGGETSFVSTYEVYEELPRAMKQILGKLLVLFDPDPYQPLKDASRDPREIRETTLSHARGLMGPTVHPLTIRHPESGRKGLFAPPVNTARLIGIGREEGERLLADITGRVLESTRIYSHTWQTGDMLVWNQLGTWHRREPVNPSLPRHLRNFRTVFETAIIDLPEGATMNRPWLG